MNKLSIFFACTAICAVPWMSPRAETPSTTNLTPFEPDVIQLCRNQQGTPAFVCRVVCNDPADRMMRAEIVWIGPGPAPPGLVLNPPLLDRVGRVEIFQRAADRWWMVVQYHLISQTNPALNGVGVVTMYMNNQIVCRFWTTPGQPMFERLNR